jgi:hypothetical protein
VLRAALHEATVTVRSDDETAEELLADEGGAKAGLGPVEEHISSASDAKWTAPALSLRLRSDDGDLLVRMSAALAILL